MGIDLLYLRRVHFAKLQLAGVDMSVPALSLLEGQKRPVSDIELNALADILHVSVDWLLGRE